MNTIVQRKIELLPGVERRIEELGKQCRLPSSARSLKQAGTLCGIARAMLQAMERCGASPVLRATAGGKATVERCRPQVEEGDPATEGGRPQAIEFCCGTAAGVKGRIVVAGETAIVSLTYMSSRVSADSLTEFWQRLGNVLQRHKRLTFLRNKKIGLQLHLPVSEVEKQLLELADRAYLEAIAVISNIMDRELLSVAKVLDVLLPSDGRDSMEARPI